MPGLLFCCTSPRLTLLGVSILTAPVCLRLEGLPAAAVELVELLVSDFGEQPAEREPSSEDDEGDGEGGESGCGGGGATGGVGGAVGADVAGAVERLIDFRDWVVGLSALMDTVDARLELCFGECATAFLSSPFAAFPWCGWQVFLCFSFADERVLRLQRRGTMTGKPPPLPPDALVSRHTNHRALFVSRNVCVAGA